MTTNITKFFAILCFGFCITRITWAWDAEGHMVVAQIAYNHLDAAVKAKCDALIAIPVYHSSSINSNFVTASAWADDIKSFTSAYSDSHYIDIPISLDGYPTNGVVNDPSNVVVAIRSSITTLQDPTQSLSNQAVALRFLIHFCGDITQPLHCSTGVSTNMPAGDAGGNDFIITGQWDELHALWDGGGGYLTDSVARPFTPASQAIIVNKAAAVEAAYPYSTSIGSIPDPATWSTDSWQLAKTVAYVGISSNVPPSTAYTNAAQSTTIQRMAIGGQRLAKLLSTIYVTNAPPLTSTLITNSNFNLSWGAVTGRIYRVQWKDQVTNAAWTDLTDLSVSNTSISFSDPVTQPQRFYRVIVVN
jgi:S1/P1 nuclease